MLRTARRQSATIHDDDQESAIIQQLTRRSRTRFPTSACRTGITAIALPRLTLRASASRNAISSGVSPDDDDAALA
jgi:hypothetical protein